MNKKFVSVFAAASVFFGGSGVVFAGSSFSDVPTNHWAYNYISSAAADGAVSGLGSGKFNPSGQVTNAQLIAIITRAFFGDKLSQKSGNGPWYKGNMEAALNIGLLEKLGVSYLNPDSPSNRYIVAAVVNNVLRVKLSADNITAASESRIPDFANIPAVYKEAVRNCYGMGIMSGKDAQGRFLGDKFVTRAEITVIYSKLQSVLSNGGSPLPSENKAAPKKKPEKKSYKAPDGSPQIKTNANDNNQNIQMSSPESRDINSDTVISSQQLKTGVIDIVNTERAKAGLTELIMNDELNNLADIRAKELLQNFSHTRPDDSACYTVLDNSKIKYHSTGENIAAGQATSDDVMKMWMNSSGHRANILNSDFNQIGIGYVKEPASQYTHYWVQIFVGD